MAVTVPLDRWPALYDLAKFIAEYLAEIQTSPFQGPVWKPSRFLADDGWIKRAALGFETPRDDYQTEIAAMLADLPHGRKGATEHNRKVTEAAHARAVAASFDAALERDECYRWLRSQRGFDALVSAFRGAASGPTAFCELLLCIVNSLLLLPWPLRAEPTKETARSAMLLIDQLLKLGPEGLYGMPGFDAVRLQHLRQTLAGIDARPATKRARKLDANAGKRAAMNAFLSGLKYSFDYRTRKALGPVDLRFARFIGYRNPSAATTPSR